MHCFSRLFLSSLSPAACLAALALSQSAPAAVILDALPLAGRDPAGESLAIQSGPPAISATPAVSVWAALPKLPAGDSGADLRALRFGPDHGPLGVAADEVSRSPTLLIGTGGSMPAGPETGGARSAISVMSVLSGGKAVRVAALDSAWVLPALSESSE